MIGTYLALDEMPNSRLGHDGDGDCVHDLPDHLGVAHACYAALGSDVCGHALEGHDGDGTGLLCNAGLHSFVSFCLQDARLGLEQLGVCSTRDLPAQR